MKMLIDWRSIFMSFGFVLLVCGCVGLFYYLGLNILFDNLGYYHLLALGCTTFLGAQIMLKNYNNNEWAPFIGVLILLSTIYTMVNAYYILRVLEDSGIAVFSYIVIHCFVILFMIIIHMFSFIKVPADNNSICSLHGAWVPSGSIHKTSLWRKQKQLICVSQYFEASHTTESTDGVRCTQTISVRCQVDRSRLTEGIYIDTYTPERIEKALANILHERLHHHRNLKKAKELQNSLESYFLVFVKELGNIPLQLKSVDITNKISSLSDTQQ